jgi:uncharacterized protein YjbI with pentapeptide repeats
MADKPRVTQDPMYRLLRDENVAEFNQRRAAGEKVDLRGVDLRGLDLRNLKCDGLDFGDAYFRGCDLRGVDFRGANLEGASLVSANISGCYFPKALRAEEILLSVTHGIRLRYAE